MPTRRDIITAMAALPAALGARPAAAALSSASHLADLAAARGLFFGSAVTSKQIAAADAYAGLLESETSVWTPEWQLKWGDVELVEGTRDYRGVDAIVRAARTSGKRVRGHALLWHEQWPDWGGGLGSPQDWDRHVVPWLAETASRYADDIFQWDVVNEPVEPEDGIAGGLRGTPFLAMRGPSYLVRALELAHEHAPGARLYLNEYGICYAERWQEARRNAMLRLMESLLVAGAPLHGLGVQAHLDIRDTFDEKVFARFLGEVAGLGLEITLTELDVREGDGNRAPLADRRQRAADEVRKVVSVALDQAAVKGVVTWALCDHHSWLRRIRGIVDNQGLPYGDDCRPAPMRSVLAELFQHAVIRDA